MSENEEIEYIDYRIPTRNSEDYDVSVIDSHVTTQYNCFQSEIHYYQSSVEDIENDYHVRVNQLKKSEMIADRESFSESDELNINDHQDLENLNQKIKNNDLKSKQKQKSKKQKKSYVQPNLLRATLLTSIALLYKYTVNSYSDRQKCLILSHFNYDQIVRIEHKLFKSNNLQDKLLVLMTNFKQVFKIQSSTINQPRIQTKNQTILYPDEFITYFASFLSAFNFETRIVLAVDMVFTGLESKFKVRAYDKVDEKKQNTKIQDLFTQTNRIQPEVDTKNLQKAFNAKNDEFLQELSFQPESLDQFIFKKESKNGKTNIIQDKLIESNQIIENKQYAKQKQQIKNNKLQIRNYDLFEKNNCLWIEIFYENTWVTFDPVYDSQFNCDIEHIKSKLHKTQSLYIFSMLDLEFEDQFINGLMQESSMFANKTLIDLTYKFLLDFQFIVLQKIFSFLQASKITIIIGEMVQYVYERIKYDLFIKYIVLGLIYNGPTKFLNLRQKSLYDGDRLNLQEFQLQQRPNQEKDYKYHPLYILESSLNQYQMIKPNAIPCDFKFKDDQVYLKQDIIVLHSRDRWRERLLEVRQSEIPIKEVTGRFDKTKILPLYAEWQCDPLKISISELNGNLPQNQYGNFEVFVHPPPRDTILFNKLGIKKLLQKSNIPFVEAVDGFDQTSGKMFAQKCGYLIFIKDYELVQELYENNLIETRARQKKNKQKELQKLWSDLFKSILIKKQLQDAYKD